MLHSCKWKLQIMVPVSNTDPNNTKNAIQGFFCQPWRGKRRFQREQHPVTINRLPVTKSCGPTGLDSEPNPFLFRSILWRLITSVACWAASEKIFRLEAKSAQRSCHQEYSSSIHPVANKHVVITWLQKKYAALLTRCLRSMHVSAALGILFSKVRWPQTKLIIS